MESRPTDVATKPKNDSILKTLHEVDADVLVLTETNSCIDLGGKYTSFPTTCLFQSLSIGNEPYEQGENRVTIWSKLPARRRFDVCNSHSAVCVQLTTDWGELNVYGTVIGIYGTNRGQYEPTILSQTDFERTLDVQLADWERLAELGSLCIAGDFNQSLGNSYYFSEEHRQRILDCFHKLNIVVPTKKIPKNIDHIAISSFFFNPIGYRTEPWPGEGKTDHQGVWLTIKRP